MKKKAILILGAAAVVALAIILIVSKSTGTLNRGEADFLLKDTASVTKIILSNKTPLVVTLSKTPGEVWKVNDRLIAEPFMVKMLLTTMMHLEVRYPVSNAEKKNVISRLSSVGTRVEVFQTAYRVDLFGVIKWFEYEKSVQAYYVGGHTQDMLGTYMQMEEAENPYVIHVSGFNGFLTTRYSVKRNDWRDHTVVNESFSSIVGIEVNYPADESKSFQIENRTNESGFTQNLVIDQYEIMLSNAQNEPVPFDTGSVIRYLSAFDHLKCEAYIATTIKDSILSQQPANEIDVKLTSGEVLRFAIYKKAADAGQVDLFGSPVDSDLDRFYLYDKSLDELMLAQYYVFDPVLKALPDFQ